MSIKDEIFETKKKKTEIQRFEIDVSVIDDWYVKLVC